MYPLDRRVCTNGGGREKKGEGKAGGRKINQKKQSLFSVAVIPIKE